MNRSVYLAGPIAGLTYEQAREWRHAAAGYLRNYGIEAFDPLRGSAELKGTGVQSVHAPNSSPLTTQKGIMCMDYHFVKRAGVVLCNFQGATQVSIGSVMECAWTMPLQKPLVVVGDEHHDHAMMKERADFWLDGLDEALYVTKMLLTA